MKKIIALLAIFIILINCNKTEKMKNKLFPERPYEDAKIDKFYWADSGWDYTMIPLIKPFQLIKLQGNDMWQISTGFNKFDEISISPIDNFNLTSSYIYGHKIEEIRNFDNRKVIVPAFWFIIDLKKGTKEISLSKFNSEQELNIELKKLNLPEIFLNPDEVYEQYKQDPVLPWFPEDIKKQLKEAKAKQGK
ncbi:hypothetical protein NAL32_18850 [Chryseobacterium sp. Ch-15]|uniref:Uncharacterized protein n=1 Tax=Chryseobacterium muglaense TaxID=2893752 RepID=A0A9Q3UYK3_9FLAO|nr:hypothetical protein [Chryseobacterium muglaense]MBD3907191.1 hypothetical protein [Chryseobacterium muglaense]MCC9036356.1 hypothetical protein [Chryseobacterium muglaense]MCM2556451.1 hypothetical protein [Chryseobacterium muglaense]